MADLSVDYPVLLGPVRLETRFTATELLIRIFPDEWAIDKFEPRPTEAELTALDAYWTAHWRAGGSQLAERAAWHELTGRIPGGRASWLLSKHVPANPADKPAVVPGGTTVLVIFSHQPLPANDRQPAVTYWTAVWRAHGDRLKLRNADIALLTAVGPQRAQAIRARPPSGVDAAPVTAGDAVLVAFLVLPRPPAAEIAPASWTLAARARLLPDRFTVLGYVGTQQVLTATGAPVPATLAVSPDPETATADQLKVDEKTGKLHVPDALLWLTDFDRAVAVGMGLRVPLQDSFRDGLDRLVVLGLRQGGTPDQAATDLAGLLQRQLRSPAGLSLLPQGTPTNNTEQAPAGQDAREEAEAGLRTAFGFAAEAAPDDWTAKTDGQWLAELLGIAPETLTGMPNADQTDLRDARAANVALWPATWGGFLRTTLDPIIPAGTADRTRELFVRHVSGRGPVPAIKIGRQPYGILPTTAFSRLAWPDSAPEAAHRRGLKKVLDAAAADWAKATAKVARLGEDDDGDPHQRLLDILALHPTSAEYYQRYAQSVEDLFNRENLGARGPDVITALDQLNMPGPVRALLGRLGYPGSQDPALIRRLFNRFQHPLLAPLVDDRPLSETDPVREYTADHRNYLRWLADAARGDLDVVRLEDGFIDGRPPAALLYLLLRHAVLLGWEDAARRLVVAAGQQPPPIADPPFIHIKITDPPPPSESRYRTLYSANQAITGSPDRLLHKFIADVIGTRTATAQLTEQIRALELLAGLPTARLERVLAEHLDCATYRLDAWRLGLANERLAELRYGPGGGEPARRGIHLGAYGWLESVEPKTQHLTQVPLTGKLAEVFGGTSVPHDPDNGGYIHAPSPGHARTAAVLRAGYTGNRTPEIPGPFAVNLNSERVRIALTMLDGLRQGQSLGALLGYRFERGLHDRHAEAELDTFIPALRGAFPLRAGRLSASGADLPPGTPVEQIEARNVVDGLELVRRVTRTQHTVYPFGAPNMPDADTAQKAAINGEVRRLLDIHDSLADLAVAEGTHQALLGNADRASATLDAYAKEGFPPEPAVVATPRSGITLTHRFGIYLRPGLDPGSSLSRTPRAQAEPAVNDWLPALVPQPLTVAAVVTWTDPADGDAHERVVTMSDLDLQPIDLLWAVRTAGDGEMTDLDDRIIGFVVDRDRPRPDAELIIRHTRRVSGKITFFELSPLIDALRSLLTTGRPLRSSDLVPASASTGAERTADDAVSMRRDRPASVREALDDLRVAVDEYLADLGPRYPEPPAVPDRAAIISGIDDFLGRYATLISGACGFGMVRSGWGEQIVWRRGVFADLLAAVAGTAGRMAGTLASADALIVKYDALPSSATKEERFRLLEQAERLLTTKPTSPRPGTPSGLRSIVGDRRRAFNTRLEELKEVAETTETTLGGLFDEVADLLPLTDFDATGLDLTPLEDRVVTQGQDLLNRTVALRTEIAARLTAADAALAAYDAAVTGPDKVHAATGALKALLGEDVLAVPEFTPPEQLAEDWRDAKGDSDRLVKHLVDDYGRDFPVDDWVHGVARVREKPRLWEKAVTIGDALRGPGGLLSNILGWQEPPLEPIQMPYREDDHWLGMEFAADTEITEDKVLFTAHYATPPPLLGGAHCGLLFDEWTEVIPAERETTGIALNYDRPDSEPPQAMLLVAPPVKSGSWQPDDLVTAITETFELAKARAVEPEHLDDTAYAQLLPATVLSATRQPITISTDLAIANLRWKAHD